MTRDELPRRSADRRARLLHGIDSELQRTWEAIGVAVGDILEAKVERGKITLTPKSVLDRDIDEAIKEFEAGLGRGPFSTADEAIATLHAGARKLKARGRRSAR